MSRRSGCGGVRELAELAGDEVGRLLADVDRVVADPLQAAGDEEHAQAPLALVGVAAEVEHVAHDPPVRLGRSARRGRRGSPRLRRRASANESSATRIISSALEAISSKPSISVSSGGSPCASFVSLAMVTQRSAMRSRWRFECSTASTKRRSTGDRGLAREQRLDRLLEREVPRVDLVVERDHLVGQLGVVLAERIDRAPERAENEVALLEQRRLQSVHLLLQRHAHRDEPTRIARSRNPRCASPRAA